jgi:MscS family membrane protein
MSVLATQVTTWLKNLDAPSFLLDNSVLAWLALLLGAVLGVLAGRLTTMLLAFLARRCNTRGWNVRAQSLLDLAGPASLGLLTLGLLPGFSFLAEKPDFVGPTLLLLAYLSVFWYLFNLLGLIGLAGREANRLRPDVASVLDRGFLPLIQRALRVCLLVIAVLVIARNVLQQNIGAWGAWLTGLGIVGLAVSLAAQDTLKHLFGSLAILLDRPFGIGDRIVSCGFEGTVEDIGFRSTKIRTDDGRVACIPNSNIANGPIENISRRPALRRVIHLAIPARTSTENLREAMAALLQIFHKDALGGPVCSTVNGVACPPQVCLDAIESGHLQLSILYWYTPATDPNYAAHAEQVNLRILDVLHESGVELWQPACK